jgi:hypothetical protein
MIPQSGCAEKVLAQPQLFALDFSRQVPRQNGHRIDSFVDRMTVSSWPD